MRSLYYLNLSYTNNGAQVSKIYKFYANGQMAVESIVNTLHLKLAGKDNVRIFIQPASPNIHFFGVRYTVPYELFSCTTHIVCPADKIEDVLSCLYSPNKGVIIEAANIHDHLFDKIQSLSEIDNNHESSDVLRPKVPYEHCYGMNVCGIEHSLSMANADMLEWVQKQAKAYIENDVKATMEMYSKKSTKEDDKMFKIKDVQFHKDITTVIWSDDTKTMVKSPHGTITSDHDRQEGLMWALAKKFFGNKYDSLKEMDKILDSRRNDEYVVYIHYNDDGESFQRLTYLVVADNLKHAYKKAKARAKKDGLDISFIKAYPTDKDLFYTVSRHTDDPEQKYLTAQVEARNEQHAIQRVAERDKVTLPGKKFTYKIESAKPAYDSFNCTRID